MHIDIKLALQRPGFTLDAKFRTPVEGVTALFGPSGVGKTTLLRAIAGLERARGHVRVGDAVWQDAETFLPVHERAVGYVFQEASLFPHLNTRANLEYGFRRIPASQRRLDFASVVTLLKLDGLLDRHSHELSGGEKQRVALGRALLASPSLLLMDEPLASLDAGHKRELLPFLERLYDDFNLPVIYVSHAHDEVARLADHLVLMLNGRTVTDGPVNEMLTNVSLPLARDEDGSAVVQAQVGDYAQEFDLTELKFSGGNLVVPGRVDAPGSIRRIRVMARDVSLTLNRQTDTSILNIVPASILDIASDDGAQSVIRLDAGGTVLLARITRKSVAALGLQTGMRVYAQIKTVALLN